MANTARTYKNTLASSKPGEKETRGRPPKKCAVASSNSDTTKPKKCKKPSRTVKNTLASSKPGEKRKPGRPRKDCAVASAKSVGVKEKSTKKKKASAKSVGVKEKSTKKKKDAEDPQDIPEDIPFMNEDEVSIVSLFSFFESDNRISLESVGVPELPAIPTVLEEPAIPTTFAVSHTDIQLDPFTDCLTDIQLMLLKTLVYRANLPIEHRHLLTSLLVKELAY